MNTTSTTRRASILVATALTAIVALAGAAQAASALAPTPFPKAGQCKLTAEAGIGISPGHAQQAWSVMVAGKYTNNWAHWVAAKNTVVVPFQNGAQTLYQASARPCYIPQVG